mmetsp:Transcript_39492/g.77699  ORF Transcript_39492/g.77699 Transcript_39492/m.77699 type:complete len:148 (+) Transcript_39492:19-462(+)
MHTYSQLTCFLLVWGPVRATRCSHTLPSPLPSLLFTARHLPSWEAVQPHKSLCERNQKDADSFLHAQVGTTGSAVHALSARFLSHSLFYRALPSLESTASSSFSRFAQVPIQHDKMTERSTHKNTSSALQSYASFPSICRVESLPSD